MNEILVLFYSKHGATSLLAEEIAKGVESVGAVANMRTVPEVSTHIEQASQSAVPSKGAMYVSHKDLENCDGIALGAPTHFGNMPASMKYFWDSTSPQWLKGSLIDKPATVFSSSSSMHGGQESTLLSMMLPLIHHGAIIMGIPYSESALHETQSGGTPYGVTSVQVHGGATKLSPEEKTLAFAVGRRLAQLSTKLKQEK